MLEAIDTSKGGGTIHEYKNLGCFCFAPACGASTCYSYLYPAQLHQNKLISCFLAGRMIKT